MTSGDEKVLDASVQPRPLPPRRAKRSQNAPDTLKRRANPAPALWTNAQRAARSAKLLLDACDWDGATDRSYYAVFGAARAALASVRSSLANSKGHGTIVRRFEKHLVQERGLDRAFSRSFFGRLSHARWVADYGDVRVDEATARAMLAEAERFLAAVGPLLNKAKQ